MKHPILLPRPRGTLWELSDNWRQGRGHLIVNIAAVLPLSGSELPQEISQQFLTIKDFMNACTPPETLRGKRESDEPQNLKWCWG